jgi:hypothetical protein
VVVTIAIIVNPIALVSGNRDGDQVQKVYGTNGNVRAGKSWTELFKHLSRGHVELIYAKTFERQSIHGSGDKEFYIEHFLVSDSISLFHPLRSGSLNVSALTYPPTSIVQTE